MAAEGAVVRRLTALAITLTLAWILVVRLGTEPAGSAALALGVALVAASIVGWLVAFLRLPRITGYLAFGLICGPAVANIITADMARDLRAVSGFAIALIAFIAGLQFQLRPPGSTLGRVALFSVITVVAAWLGMVALLFVAWPWLPLAPELSGALRVAAVALSALVLVGVSPTVTVAVIAEARARGALSSLATTVVILIELIIIVLFVFLLQGARLVTGGPQRWRRSGVSGGRWPSAR
jgi:Kef-type K+ transport system membrane component KefB